MSGNEGSENSRSSVREPLSGIHQTYDQIYNYTCHFGVRPVEVLLLSAVPDCEDAVVESDGGAVGAAEDARLVQHELAVRRVDRHRDGAHLTDGGLQRALVPANWDAKFIGVKEK